MGVRDPIRKLLQRIDVAPLRRAPIGSTSTTVIARNGGNDKAALRAVLSGGAANIVLHLTAKTEHLA